MRKRQFQAANAKGPKRARNANIQGTGKKKKRLWLMQASEWGIKDEIREMGRS